MADYKINILHLFPDLLNLYGDKGNIASLKKRLEWRGIQANVIDCTEKNPQIDFENSDIIFLGGGSDRETEIVSKYLMERKSDFKEYAEKEGTLLAFCSGYEMLGKRIKTLTEEKEGLGVLDIYTEIPDDNSRLIGNIVIDAKSPLGMVVGFENHSGRVDIGNYAPLGKVVTGFGNDDSRMYEGLIYKNVLGTYMHGPLLPKNPILCDRILENALIHKYSDFKGLAPLDNTLEDKAKSYMLDVLL